MDPVASCGNGRIDSTGGAGFEACDVGRDGRIIRPPTPQEFVGVKDLFGQSGTPDELLEHYGMTEKDIMNACRKVIGRKNQ